MIFRGVTIGERALIIAEATKATTEIKRSSDIMISPAVIVGTITISVVVEMVVLVAAQVEDAKAKDVLEAVAGEPV